MLSYQKYTISAQSLLKLCLFFGLAAVVVLLRQYALILLAAIIIAMVLRPMVAWLNKKGVFRSLAVIGIFVFIVLFFVTWLIVFTPLLQAQLKEIIHNLPGFLKQIDYWIAFVKHQIGINIGSANFSETINVLWQGKSLSIGSLVTPVAASFLKLVIFFMAVFYFMWDEKVWDRIAELTGRHRSVIRLLIIRVEERLSRWAVGQLILCFVIFLLVFIALWSLGIKYSLLLALLAGLLEAVPYLGPLTTGLIVGLFTLASEPTKFFWSLLALYIIQVTENNLLVPQIMARAVGVNALSVLLMMLAATKIFGLLGTFLAVPFLVMVKNTWLLWQQIKNQSLSKYEILKKNS